MSQTRPFPAIPLVTLLIGGVLVGFGPIFMRLAEVNPLASAFWRMALAAPFLWAWTYAVRHRDHAAGKRADPSMVVILSGLLFAADMSLWHLSLSYTTVANATLLTNFAPIFIALWLWVAYKVRFARAFLIGMVLALIGAALLVGPNASGGKDKLLGDCLGLASALFYAAYQLTIKDARDNYSTARLMAWSTTATALALLPFALFAPGPFIPTTAGGWLPLLSLALIAQLGGQSIIAYAFAHLPASLSSVSLLIQPLTAAVAAWLIFQEAMFPLQVLGAALLLWGIYLAKKGS